MPRKFNRRPRRPRRRPRKYKKRKPAYKKGKYTAPKLQVSREVKHIETALETKNIAFIAAGATQMPNGQIFYPCGFNALTKHISQGTGCNALIGCFIRPLYLTQKFKINFSNLDLDKAVSNSGLRLRCRSGWIRNTGAKCGASVSTDSTAWQNLINVMVHNELKAADYDADFLQFTRKNRNIMMYKDTFIKPKMTQRMGSDPAGANVHAQDTFAPEVNFSISWDKTKGWLRNKTRLEPTVSHATQLVLHNQFVPFVLFSCEGLTNTDQGHIEVKSSSRYYFTDA